MSRLVLAVAVLIVASFAHASEFDMQGWIDDQVDSGAVLAVAAVGLDEGEVEYFAGGVLEPGGSTAVDSNTQFEIGSVTKAFTNLLLAEMVERDVVAYSSTIGDLLGEDIEFANPAVADITLLQLAAHTSGLPRLPTNFAPTDQLDPYKEYDEDALLKGIEMARAMQPLGQHYAYSNFGVGLLGYLLGRVHGEGYAAAVVELVIEPLDLERTGFDRAAQSATAFRGGQAVKDWALAALSGAGALRSTSSDLARLAQIQLGIIGNPLRHDLEADREVVSAAGNFDVTRVWHVGQSEEGPIFWHNGGTGGFWSFFGFKPATGEAVAILVSGDPDPTSLGLRWLGLKDMRPPRPVIDAGIPGQYDLNPSFGIGVYEINGALVAQASGQVPVGLHRIDDNWYAMDVVDASLHFIREEGKVVALELAQNGMLQRAAKTSDTAAALAREEVEIPRGELAAFVGEYALNPSITFTIRLGEQSLEAMLTGQPFFPVYPQGDDRFFYKVVDAELQFERAEDGSVNALVLHQGGIMQRAEKIN